MSRCGGSLFSLPLFRYVSRSRRRPPSSAGWRELWHTLRDGAARPAGAAISCWPTGSTSTASDTLQQMAVDFGIKLGFSSNALIQALLLVQFIAFPCALLFGRLGDRIGTKRAIYLGLAVFVGADLLCLFHAARSAQFYILAAVVGTVQGGVQALSRSYFARLIPRERAGEYFGFYNMLAKFAAVLGPLAMGVVAIATGNQRLSILVLEFFFIGGALLLARVRDPEPRLRSARLAGAAGRSTARATKLLQLARRWPPARSAAARNAAPVL